MMADLIYDESAAATWLRCDADDAQVRCSNAEVLMLNNIKIVNAVPLQMSRKA